MILIKSSDEIDKMKKSGELLAACHRELRKVIRPDITTIEINDFAEKFIIENGGYPAQKGYKGYKHATCTSVNDEICHSVPSKRKLNNGDIITVDIVVNINGWLADSAWSYAVGSITEEAKKLLEVTEKSLYIGIDKAIIGNRIGDISNAIQTYAESKGYSVVREYLGHGIGKNMHETPEVPHFGRAGRGMRIEAGMVFTIEPMINIGGYALDIDLDGWTSRTRDKSLSAQYEHTIAITKDGPVILTKQ